MKRTGWVSTSAKPMPRADISWFRLPTQTASLSCSMLHRLSTDQLVFLFAEHDIYVILFPPRNDQYRFRLGANARRTISKFQRWLDNTRATNMASILYKEEGKRRMDKTLRLRPQRLGLRTVTVITVYGRTVYGPVTVSVRNDVTLQVPYTAPAIFEYLVLALLENGCQGRKLRITAVPYLDRIRTVSGHCSPSYGPCSYGSYP
ncbi:hypothetical protein DFH11DRAFT_473555 [Phellopilus nigrolimitatus]|nr:hypothetical protein DFH11DRAFT_473555 [Phellopilus nigrolimitatus]